MTDFLAYILITALLLVSLFLVCVVVVACRSRYHDAYVPSPGSRVTPLGYYSAQQHRRVAHGVPGSRSYVPYIEEAETVKVKANHD
jgi:hypothetical protein